MTFALDTNTVAYFLRGEGGVAQRLLARRPRDLALPSIVVYAVRHGLARWPPVARRRIDAESFLTALRVLDFDAEAAAIATDVRVELERVGQPIGALDVLIAATACAPCGTRDAQRAGLVPHTGLAIENGYDA